MSERFRVAGPAPVAGDGTGSPDGDVVIDRRGLERLIEVLAGGGRRVLGPVVRDGTIVLAELSGSGDLPRGWHDEQAPGSYRLEYSGDEALFSWAVGPHSVKARLFPPRATEWRAQLDDGDVSVVEATDEEPPLAVIGARPCELAALDVLDAALPADPRYRRRRESAVLVAVECGTPSGTCFCASMGSGPSAEDGFDLALTELLDEDGQRFLVRVGSRRGAELLGSVPQRQATAADSAARQVVLEQAVAQMGRSLDTTGIAELLARNIEHPRWDEVADRCLACGNCTLVCPTCFCSTVEDVSDLNGTVERRRSWSSCFDLAHSYLHGGPVRQSTRSRYRQWLTHKVGTWWEQFGMSGCIGCGRCITWCPVGIDITEELAAIRATDGAAGRPSSRRTA